MMPLAVRRDAPASLVDTDGDMAPLAVDAVGSLRTTVLEINPGISATSLGKAEDTAHGSGQVGVMALAVRNDSTTPLATSDGFYSPLTTDHQGRLVTIKRGGQHTYSASSNVTFTSIHTAMFCLIAGSATRKVTVQRIKVSGLHTTTAQFVTLAVERWSSLPTTFGTAMTKVRHDTLSPVSTVVNTVFYAAAPVEGTLVGTLATERTWCPPAAAGTTRSPSILFDFRNVGEATGIVLRGLAQCLSVAFVAAPTTAITMTVDIEWIEEAN